MKKTLTICFAAAFCTIVLKNEVKAQAIGYNSAGNLDHIVVDGVISKEKSYSNNTEISGSPFYLEDWTDGVLVTESGDSYKTVLKFDAYKNQLVVPGKDDEPALVTSAVKTFSLGDLAFAKGFPAYGKATDKTFYQVLNVGKAVLLKRQTRTVLEERDISGVVVAHKFENGTEYYLYKDNKMTSISPTKVAILAALADKPQMADYFKTNKVNFKSDADLGKVFIYYNTL